MREQEAESLVDATFTTAYNEDKFRLFVRNLLHDHEECAEQSSTGKYIWEAFQDGITSYKRLFKFTDPEGMEIDVLAVKLKSVKTLENARTMQRNFVARYLNGSRGGTLKDAALVAFYADDSDDWRFSLVRMDYVLDAEKNKVEKELTPARRFSFLVGGNEKTHTARRQFFPILKGDTETTLTELEQAFNIESVTKEFFEQYKELFLRLTESLDKVRRKNPAIDSHLILKKIETSDLCKKLLGQIVFLYFLQKKGWLGVDKNEKWGTGDKNYLRSLLENCQSKGQKYFDDYLEPLFYEALATERDRHYYSRFNCKIPFLNGGLFEPTNDYAWEEYDFNIPNELFSNNSKTKSGDNGDGILDIFDRYNFTVREDESLEKEVAVDPEMLGKVFENLLEVKDRKSKGAFYTPREIVHYMCQESLINYLDAKLNIQRTPIDNNTQKTLLPELTSTDLLTEYEENYKPIVPKDDITDFIYHGDSFRENDATTKSKGKETSTYSFKLPESIRKHAKAIDKALADVKICDPAIGSGAFPVGIMHEIVRARLTLLESRLIKQTNKTNAYEYKRRAIQQSIYGVDIEESAIEIAKLRLWLSLVVDEVDMDEIQPLPNLTYKIVKGNSLLGIEKDLFNNDALKQLEELKELYFDETSKGKKQKYKRDIDKIIKSLAKDGQFDFEIFFSEVFSKNGGFDIVIGNPPYGTSIKGKDRKVVLSGLPKVPDYEIYYFFIERAKKLVSPMGIKSYIIPNTFLFNVFAANYRINLLEQWIINLVVDCTAFKLFETATVHNVITFFQNPYKKIEHIGYKNTQGALSFQQLSQRQTLQIPKKDLTLNNVNWGLVFKLPPPTLKIVSKIKILGQDLISVFPDISQGLIAYDRYKGQSELDIKNRIYHFHEKTKSGLKQWLWGEDVTPYKVKWNEKEYLDYCSGIANPRNPKYFQGSRVLIREITNPKIFAGLSIEEQYHDPAIISILADGDDALALLGILNSKLATFYHFNTSPKATKGAFPKILVKDIKEFPLPDWEKSKVLVPIVKELLILINKERTDSIKSFEQKIDTLVYQLYDLTPEEITIVEGSVK